jgi:hypothetical protein
MGVESFGVLVGAMFGLSYVWANTGSLGPAASLGLRVLGAVTAVAALALLPRRAPQVDSPALRRRSAGRGYGLVVGAEVVAGVLGLIVLNGPLDEPHATVGWISVVVGAHFLALSVVVGEPMFSALGGSILVCGTVGVVLALAGASTGVTDVVAGVLPGELLLMACVISGAHGRRRRAVLG